MFSTTGHRRDIDDETKQRGNLSQYFIAQGHPSPFFGEKVV